MNKQIKWKVFIPTICIFITFIIVSFIDDTFFTTMMMGIYNTLLENFGWLILSVVVVILICCIYVYFSPLGNVRFGGEDAKPMLSTWSWFTVTLTTTIAAGVVFWGAAEPVQHILNPPSGLGIEPMSVESARFAIATIFRHWTVLPYAIYTLFTIVFAYVFYNLKESFSIGSILFPLFDGRYKKNINLVVDIICVFSLVAGLAASLSAGVLSVNGGLAKLFGVESNAGMWGIIILSIMSITLLAGVTGIGKGIKHLSNINVFIYFVILAFIFIFGGSLFILNFGLEGLGEFADTFFSGILYTGALEGDSWPLQWTTFYFGNWFAWAPITAVFLGRICYGRTVKEAIQMNLLVTSFFGICWFSIISGATVKILFENPRAGIVEAYQIGYENVIYQLFVNLPLQNLLIPLYLVAVALSFATAADSTITAISGICSTGMNTDMADPPKCMIIAWTVIISLFTWIMMLVGEGITGMKILSNIGGFPAMILAVLTILSILKVIRKMKQKVIKNE